jgi:PAS domain S-box-containing protein
MTETSASRQTNDASQDAPLSDRPKQSEAILRASEGRYRTLFNLVPVAVYSCDANGMIAEFNQRAAELWGREPRLRDRRERYCGSFKIYFPDGQRMPHDKCPMARILRGETIEEGDAEILVERPDGLRKSVVAHPQAIRNERGEIIGAINCLYDVTERKRTEEALRESEGRYRALTELSPQFVFMGRPDGDIIFANQYAQEFTGRTQEELQGDHWTELIHPDERERVLATWMTATRDVAEYTIEIPLRRADGAYRWLDLRALPIMDGAGAIAYWLVVALDVTDRKELERVVAERASLLEAVFAAAPDRISIFDETGKLMRLNPAAQRIARPERERASMETVGQIFDLRTLEGAPFPPDELPAARALRGEIVQGVEMLLRDAEQHDQTILTSAAPFFDITGQLQGAVALAHDITTLRAAERAAATWAAQLDAMFDALTDGFFIYDSAGQLARMNDASRAILALDAAPDYYSLTPAERAERLHVRDEQDRPLQPEEWGLTKLARGERLAEPVEIRITALDGCVKDLAITGGPVRDPQGAVTGAVALLRDVTDRRRLERAATEHASQLQATFNALAEPMCVFDADGRILRQNMADLVLFGFDTPPATIEERAARIKLRDTERHRLSTEQLPARKVLSGATLVGVDAVELVARGADGHDRWFSVGGAPIRDDAGQIIGGVIVYRDVTERRSLERQVTEQVERLQTIFETIADAIFLFDAQGQIIDANPAGRRQLPSAIADFNSSLLQERNASYVLRDAHGSPMNPADWPVTRLLRGEALTGEATVDMVALLPDGRERWLSVSGAPIRDQVGQVIGAVGVTRDITERRQLEQRTRWQASLLERAHDAIFMWELDGPIVYWNHGAELLYGFSRDEAVGQISHQLLQTKRPVSPRRFKAALQRNSEWIGEIGHTTRDGHRLVVESRHQLLTEADGRHYVLETCRDITERLKLEQDLRRSHDELEQRVRERTRDLNRANASLRRMSRQVLQAQESERRRIARELHDEIGQALIGVKMMIETAERRSLPTGVRDAIDEALTRVRELSLDLRPAMLDNLGLLPTLLWRFENYARQTLIHVEFHHTGLDRRFSPEIETGAYRIVQEALTNVARHADVRHVTVQLSATEETLKIYVVDQGNGFDADEALAAGISTGLSGMRERATLLGGVFLISSSPDAGTTIEVELPLLIAEVSDAVRSYADDQARNEASRGSATL